MRKKAAKKHLENAQLEKDIADMKLVIQETKKNWEATGNKPLSAVLNGWRNVESAVSDTVACWIFSFRGVQ